MGVLESKHPPMSLSHIRAKKIQYDKSLLVKLEGVQSRKETFFYCGKRAAFVYKIKTSRRSIICRCSWGKVIGSHGSSGIVRVMFRKSLPPCAMGENCRIMLYPSHT